MSEKKTLKILIGIPMMDMVHADFFSSFIALKRNTGTCHVSIAVDSLVYNARNNLVATAIDGEYDYILWLDSDMVFDRDLLENLVKDAEENDLDYVSAICFKRISPTCPVVLKELHWNQNDKGFIDRGCTFWEDYPRDQLFEAAGTGAAALLTRVSIYPKVVKTFAIAPFEPLPAMGEDFSFCWRLKECGIRMWVDSRIKVGHVGKKIFDESVYLKEQSEKHDQSVSASKGSTGESATE